MNTLIVTPARFASSRFPGKPLAILGGREIILRVMDRISEGGYNNVVVATDDKRIYDCVTANGYRAVMTSPNHQSGTDRVCEALDIIESETGKKFDIVINVQGDEPFIDTSQIHKLEQCFDNPDVDIATLSRPFPKDGDYEDLSNPNLVKLVKSPAGKALYFSRSVIPYLRGIEEKDRPSKFVFQTHIGIYGYRPEVLRKVTRLERSPLEIMESLEQLRWLENGFSIAVAESLSENIGIDTPEDLAEAEKKLKNLME